jgi:hypothetical protein
MKRLFVLSLLFLSLTAFAEDIEAIPVVIPNAKHNGMGGDHIAYTDNVYALLVNPAAIMRVNESGSGAFALSLIDPKKTFDTAVSLGEMFYDVFHGDIKAFHRLVDIYTKSKGAPSGFDLREFPLSFAWVSNGLGVGIWNRFYIDPYNVGSQTQHNLYADVVLPISAAFPLVGTAHQSLDIGVTLKPFARIIVPGEVDDSILLPDDPKPLDVGTIPLIAGTGFDAGLIYRWDKGFSLGFTVNDIFTRGKTIHTFKGDDESDYVMTMTMNLGLAWQIKIGNFAPDAPPVVANTGITVAADWRDIRTIFWQDGAFNRENIWKEAHAGIEVVLFDTLMLRGGMRKMQPVAGIGVSLGSFQIDASFYKKEFKEENTVVPVLELTFAVRPKAKESNWFWSQNPLIGYNSSSSSSSSETGGEE